MKKISVLIAGRHLTSISLEDEFLNEIKEIAKEKNLTLNKLITEIDTNRKDKNLSSAVRLYVLNKLKNRLAEK